MIFQRQLEQLKDIKLPASANWAHQPSLNQSATSVAAIQKLEAAEEKKKEQEQVKSNWLHGSDSFAIGAGGLGFDSGECG